jgi:hypothetical protein
MDTRLPLTGVAGLALGLVIGLAAALTTHCARRVRTTAEAPAEPLPAAG